MHILPITPLVPLLPAAPMHILPIRPLYPLPLLPAAAMHILPIAPLFPYDILADGVDDTLWWFKADSAFSGNLGVAYAGTLEFSIGSFSGTFSEGGWVRPRRSPPCPCRNSSRSVSSSRALHVSCMRLAVERQTLNLPPFAQSAGRRWRRRGDVGSTLSTNDRPC